MPPDIGTRAGMPTLRTPAYTSTSTHTNSWNQASHTSSTRTAMIVLGPTLLVSTSMSSSSGAIGGPTKVSSAYGTPPTSATSTTSAPRPASTSPARRRAGTRTGTGT